MAYTYLIGWKKFDVWYYGSRYAENCDPNDLWQSYFTSSSHVKRFREEHGEPDVVEVRRLFDAAQKALDWEYKVLRRLKVRENKRWLNKTDCQGFPPNAHELRGPFTEDQRRKISERQTGSKNHWWRNNNPVAAAALSKKMKGVPKTEEHKQKMRENHRSKRGYAAPNKGIPMSEEQKQKLREKALGRGHSDETKAKLRAVRLGKKRPHTEETKVKMRESYKRRHSL